MSGPPPRYSTEIPSSCDVAVVGAGLGGLACAVELARQGLDVCVLERHRVPGGYAHGFSRKGFDFDVSLHHIGGLDPGSMTHGVLSSLGVLEKISMHRRGEIFRAEYPGLGVTLPNDGERLLDELGRLFPSERAGLADLFRFLPELKADVMGPSVVPGFSVPLEERLSTRYLDATFEDILAEHVSDPRLAAVLGQLWMYVGLPPSLSTATFTTCVFCSSFFEGAHHIEGGGGALSRAFAERLEELGGRCFTRAAVRRILVEGGAAGGVELESGHRVRARIVVSAVDPYQTFFDLIPGGDVSDVFRHRLRKMRSTLSVYSLYLGLDCQPSDLGIDWENYFHNFGADHDLAYRLVLDGEIDRTDWCLTSYECGEEPGSAASRVVSVSEVTPAADWLEMDAGAYRRRKAEVRDRLVAKYERRFPGLSEHALAMEFATPRTMHRYTGNHEGAIYGLAQTPDQSNSRRLRNRTPVRALFLTGSWTWAGGGYEGAMMTGVQTAAAVVAEMGISPTADPIRLHPPAPVEDGPVRSDRHPHRTSVRVWGDDLGESGAADASSYLRFMDRGRVEAIEEICAAHGEGSWLRSYVVNVYRLRVSFLGEAGAGERLEVRTGLRRTTSHRAAFDQRIFLHGGEEPIIDAVVEVLFLGEGGALVEVPKGVGSDAGPDDEQPSGASRPARFGERDRPFAVAPFRVYYEDTDTQGITYHAAYARFLERAISDLVWSDPGWRPGRPGRRGPRISKLDIRYMNSSHLGDRIEVRTGGRMIGPGRAGLEQRVVIVETGKVAADALIELDFHNENGYSTPVPDRLGRILG